MRTRIGRTDDFEIISVKDSERTRGMFIVGATGMGKSVALTNFIRQDLQKFGVILIEPSGFLGPDVYSLKPDLYISREYSNAVFNPMRMAGDKYQIVDVVTEFTNHCNAVTSGYTDKLSPNMRNLLAEAISDCIDRNRLRLDAVADWLRNKKVGSSLHLARDGVVARFDNIFNDEKIRRLLCAEESFDFAEFTQKKRCLVVDAYGMGLDKNVFVGSAVSYLIRAYFRNQRLSKYYPLAFFVDECQHYINHTFYDCIKEGRKYSLMVTLSTQDFASLPETFAHTILSNVGTFLALSPGAIESKRISQEMNMPWETVKFVHKHYGFVHTPSFTGLVKMNRPPIITRKPLPTYAPQQRRMWFPINV